jgi:hypothetical protein
MQISGFKKLNNLYTTPLNAVSNTLQAMAIKRQHLTHTLAPLQHERMSS